MRINIRGGGVKRQGCRERQLSAFSLVIFSETLQMMPALLYRPSDTVCRRLFSDPKMHDLE